MYLGVDKVFASTVLVVGLVAPAGARAQIPANQKPLAYQAQDLKKLSIQELSELDVTTASRGAEPLNLTAAAVSVIHQEDLRRAGITTLPEALRLATGVHAAQVFGDGWAISARGFNISTANKLLVLVDGRTIYSPVFAGVFWEHQDILLTDVDRIEVVRGPGGTLWGANAVNGVINIITRSAADTQGGLIAAGVGTIDRALAAARYGGMFGSTAYRAYAKFRAQDDRELVSGGSARDDVRFGQAGFRMDSSRTGKRSWTLQGDAYSTAIGLGSGGDVRAAGGNVLARIVNRFSEKSSLELQAYYDRTYRRVPLQYRGSRDTFDVDVQQRLVAANGHQLMFGAGARVSRGDDLGDGPGFFFEPQVRTSTLLSAFVQDQLTLIENRLYLTAGAKIERNDFSGAEFQPNVRLRWTPRAPHTVWGAVSRAVRMPTRFDTDLRIRFPGSTGRLLLTGSETFESENVISYEAGYRTVVGTRLSFDVAGYANRYTELRSQELPLAPTSPVVLANGLNARSAGLEVTSTWQPVARWQLHSSYTYLWKEFGRTAGSRDITGGASEANDPSHAFHVRSYFDLTRTMELDARLRSVSSLPSPGVPRYTEVTLRFGWNIRPSIDLSVIGQNLLHDRHVEFAAGTPREYLHRGVHIKLTWRY